MTNLVIRPAVEPDVAAITRVVDDAYADFIPLTGRAPTPMFDDYPALVAQGKVWVLLDDGAVVGAAVLLPAEDHLLLRTVAVAPSHQSGGHGRRLIAFAEEETRRRGLAEIRVFTNVTMAKSIRLYRGLGYEEYKRAMQEGYFRVFMRKRLAS